MELKVVHGVIQDRLQWLIRKPSLLKDAPVAIEDIAVGHAVSCIVSGVLILS